MGAEQEEEEETAPGQMAVSGAPGKRKLYDEKAFWRALSFCPGGFISSDALIKIDKGFALR